MSGRIYKKHENRRKLARRYINKRPFFGYSHSPYYRAWLYTSVHRRYSYRGYAEEAKLIEGMELWEIQEADRKHTQLEAQKLMDMSRWLKGGGTKSYKKTYHRMRRAEARKLEHYAMIDDELRFESIVPDGWKGGIGWDIW